MNITAAHRNLRRENTMKIEVLGTGCVDCNTLYENTRRALAESGKNGEVVKVEDIQTMLN